MFFVAKEAIKKIKLQIQAGKATPAPPVGTVLGPAGINLQEFFFNFILHRIILQKNFDYNFLTSN